MGSQITDLMEKAREFDDLAKYARRYVEDPTAAEQIVGGVVSAPATYNKFDPARRLKPFLYTRVRNACLRYLKDVTTTRPADSATIFRDQEMEALGKIPEELFSMGEQSRQLALALEELISRDAMVVVLHDLRGCELKWIAKECGSTENAIKVTYFRAKQRLRDLLESWA